MSATRYVTVRARLSDEELAALRALPGESDSERIRQAITVASRQEKIVAGVARLVVEQVGKEMEARIEGASDVLGQKIGARLVEGLTPVIEAIQQQRR